MREIKFRAWDKEKKRLMPITLMEFNQWWVSCMPISDMDCNVLEYGERNSFKNEETDRHILMQYTGLKDKNGTEIYEGDAVRLKYFSSEYIGKIVFNEKTCGFEVWYNLVVGAYGEKATRKLNFAQFGESKLEVIGNIYGNSELLNSSN